MASPGEEGKRDGGHVGRRDMKKEHTVIVNVLDITKVKAKDIIDSLTECVGFDSIYTVVPKQGNTYWVTLSDEEAVNVAVSGVRVGDTVFECREYMEKDVVVSFLHLSPFITDDAIKEKLRGYGLEILSDVKERRYGTSHIFDGTRYVKVRFPPHLKSLPYSVKFFNGDTWEYCRVIHNGQVKTCRQCLSPDHLFKDCPQFVCFRCELQGHMARACTSLACPACGRYGRKCQCDDTETETDDEDVETVDRSDREKCNVCQNFDCTCTGDESDEDDETVTSETPTESLVVHAEVHAQHTTTETVSPADEDPAPVSDPVPSGDEPSETTTSDHPADSGGETIQDNTERGDAPVDKADVKKRPISALSDGQDVQCDTDTSVQMECDVNDQSNMTVNTTDKSETPSGKQRRQAGQMRKGFGAPKKSDNDSELEQKSHNQKDAAMDCHDKDIPLPRNYRWQKVLRNRQLVDMKCDTQGEIPRRPRITTKPYVTGTKSQRTQRQEMD